MLKYHKFQAPILKWDVLSIPSKLDPVLYFMLKPNEKLPSYVFIVWEVIYTHFYNGDSPRDFVSVVYDSCELIIEASLWSKDYFTCNTHTQHTSPWFNQCLSHLCDCICSNVMCMLKFLLIKPKKIFEWFICFWKWFYPFVCLFLVKCILCVFHQNLVQGLFREKLATRNFPRKVSRLYRDQTASREMLLGKNWIFLKIRQRISRLPRDYFAT